MDLKLHVAHDQNRALDREVHLVVTASGVSFGRRSNNDVVLEDPERVISGQHARLDLRNGGLWLTDTSRNGTFLNRSLEPMPSHSAVALHDGDFLRIGPYQIQVRILDARAAAEGQVPHASSSAALPGLEPHDASSDILELLTPAPGALGRFDEPNRSDGSWPSGLADDPFADAASLDDVLGGEAPKAPPSEAPPHHTPVEHVFYAPEQQKSVPEEYDLLNDVWVPPEVKSGGPATPSTDDSEPDANAHRNAPLSSSSGSPPSGQSGEPHSSSGEVLRPQPSRRRAPPAPPPSAPDDARQASGRELDAFLSGLGVGRPSDVPEPTVLLQTSGALLRALATGLSRTLIGRAQFKSELRLGMTTIRAAENNPFKFSVGTDDLLDRLLFRPNKGFLPGAEAAQEAFDDIQAHEMAMTAGLQAALQAVLSKFDPNELANRLGEPTGLDRLLRRGRKAKCWDLFSDTYEEVAAEAKEDVMQLFGEAFASAYQEQIERLAASRRSGVE